MKAETPPSASSRPIGFTDHMMLADIGVICLHLAINIACFPSEDRRYEFSSFAHFCVRNPNVPAEPGSSVEDTDEIAGVFFLCTVDDIRPRHLWPCVYEGR